MIDFMIQEHLKVVSETFNKRAIEKIIRVGKIIDNSLKKR